MYTFPSQLLYSEKTLLGLWILKLRTILFSLNHLFLEFYLISILMIAPLHLIYTLYC